METTVVRRRWTFWAAAALILTGFVGALVADYPGHFPPDALWQLAQGRAGRFNTWHPPVMAWLLGLADRVRPGAWTFVVLNDCLFYGALFALVALERRPRFLCLPILLICMLSPVVLIFQGVVLKDVLFANAALTGFAALAWAARAWARPARRYGLFATALGAFTLATLTRQNGVIPVLCAAGALAIIAEKAAPRRGPGPAPWARAAIHAITGLALTALCATLATTALNAHADGRPENANHLKVLQVFDLAGEIHLDPSLPLQVIRSRDPALESFLRERAAPRFRSAGVDNLFDLPGGERIMPPPGGAVGSQGSAVIASRPDLYIRTRAGVWLTTLSTPSTAACPMIITGIDNGDSAMLRRAGLAARDDPKDDWDSDYASAFLHTPLYSHLFYGAVAIGALVWSTWRWRRGDRGPEAIVTIAMILAGLIFTVSFFVISIDCDYRFLYFLDVAAMAALARQSAARPPGFSPAQ